MRGCVLVHDAILVMAKELAVLQDAEAIESSEFCSHVRSVRIAFAARYGDEES